MTIFTE